MDSYFHLENEKIKWAERKFWIIYLVEDGKFVTIKSIKFS
jgi:hypothetical protein